MSATPFTLIDDGRATVVMASLAGDHVRLDAGAVHAALGWELGEDGLCREGVCVPARSADATADGIGLADLADVLGRPLALDAAERVAWLGVGADERGRALRTLVAPDFALPDLAHATHRLRDLRGRKVLLVVWASW